jgi:hypothetical protein
MRRFDGALTEKELETIARGIDALRREAAALNPHAATTLKNADEPATRFAAPRSA